MYVFRKIIQGLGSIKSKIMRGGKEELSGIDDQGDYA